jgi:thioredoxin-related protein
MLNQSAKLHLRIWLLSLLLGSCLTLQAAPPESYPFLDLTQAMQAAASENKPMFLYFGRYGCSTCRKMHKEVFSDQQLREEFTERFVLAYVDTESDSRIRLPSGERTTEMQFAARNRILGTPTFIYFDAQQKPLFKKAGFQTVEQMLGFNRYVADGHYREQTLKQFLAAK